MDSSFFRRFVLITVLWFLPFIAVSQASRQGNAPVQKKPEATFSQNMNHASRELNWSRTYYLSFKKTREAVYLKLAATHCTNAVKVLKATQASLPNTTRFYYKAKNRRFTACRFYDELQETALRLDPRHHINDISKEGCDF